MSPESDGLWLQRGGEESYSRAEHSCPEGQVPPAKRGLREGSANSLEAFAGWGHRGAYPLTEMTLSQAVPHGSGREA